MRLGLATYALLPQLAIDDQLFLMTLRQRGHRVDAVVWDDTHIDWADYDGVIIRSCWDYHKRPAEFLAWIDRLDGMGVRLWNPAPLLHWNHEKRYLIELAAQGIPIVPTIYLERGALVDLAQLLRDQQWADAVIKPAIAATAFHTWRTNITQAVTNQQQLAALVARGAVLVQPLMPEIAQGEWSLLFFGGEFSHAVLKRPAPGDFRSQDDFGGTVELRNPPPGMVDQAQHILSTLSSPWLYARVDGLVVGSVFTLMELELIEPSLFLSAAPHAANMLATALERLSAE